ncbi:MAG: ATP-dependent helicase HrpB [Desulfobulbaceae bacterium]|nr:ATP-dependent helicase HrpB [Desulfobulbaceae bacterium]
MIGRDLPVRECWPELRTALRDQGRAVLTAPPGSGKTTLLPLLLLAEEWLAGQSILMLEPRRLAARMAADRMASLLGEECGVTVGYRIRFESRISAATRIEVLTEGILTRMLQDDPALERAGLVIFDEFHERSLHGDLALALCLDSAAGLREDLRILVMSATLEVATISRLLGEAPIIRGGGRAFPVTTRHLAFSERSPATPDYSFASTVRSTASAIRLALSEQSGDILAFLPGAGEIRAVAANLAEMSAAGQIRLRPLYGELSRVEQDRAVLPDPEGGRRVVLATNIAETSLTIEGVTTVVDSGWSRVVRFDPDSGLAKLVSERVSRAAATQRAGRAGRLGPGYCYRLWDESTHPTLKEQNRPEILAADLCRLVLELAAWGVNDPTTLKWLEPPPATALARARELLAELDALDGRGNLTPHGKKLATLPLHPRLAHLLLAATALGHRDTACDLAALLSERDLLRGEVGQERPVDLELRLLALAAFRKGSRGEVRALGGDVELCRKVDQASRQFRQLCPSGPPAKSPQGIGSLLACAYPDRVAGLRPTSRERYLLASGRGAKLPGSDALAGSPWMVAASLDADRQDGRIFLAAAVSLAELRRFHAARITTGTEVEWDERDCLNSREVERFLALPLAARPGAKITPAQALPLLLAEIQKRGLHLLPWSPAARELQTRLLCLHQWQPQAAWPDFSEAGLSASLEEWLGPWLTRITCLEQLSRLDLPAILTARLEWRQRQQVDELAPTHLPVPSGSRVRLQYRLDDTPLLAVRLQEVFGLAATPRICNGLVPVTMQLLSPAGRPVQVTSDLANFWNTTYREVKKELQGRYPRHHWPDDPWTAAPTSRVKRRPGR